MSKHSKSSSEDTTLIKLDNFDLMKGCFYYKQYFKHLKWSNEIINYKIIFQLTGIKYESLCHYCKKIIWLNKKLGNSNTTVQLHINNKFYKEIHQDITNVVSKQSFKIAVSYLAKQSKPTDLYLTLILNVEIKLQESLSSEKNDEIRNQNIFNYKHHRQIIDFKCNILSKISK